MTSTRMSLAAMEAAKLMAVVVFPTPPFWLAMARTRLKGVSYHVARTEGVFHVKRRLPVSRETANAMSQKTLLAPRQPDGRLPAESERYRRTFGSSEKIGSGGEKL